MHNMGEMKRLTAAASRLFSVASASAGNSFLGSFAVGSLPAHAASGSTVTAASSDVSVLKGVSAWNQDRRWYAHRISNAVKALKYRTGVENPNNKLDRKRVVFLGTGWGAMRFLPLIDTSKYEVVLVSPRNFFVFTPLLPSVCSGALSVKSCMEPIRHFTLRGGRKVMQFYQGHADDIDLNKDTVKVTSQTGHKFDVKYDYLVMGVGSEVATFGVPGVQENCYFLKESENAEAIRRRILENFESASLPGVSDEEQRRLLHFVCVGGGPSGVETAAEIADLVKEDISVYYPALHDKVTVSIVELLPRVLAAFNEEVSNFTLKNFAKMNVDTLIRTRVTKVSPKSIHVVDSSGKEKELPCGFVMWASGIGPVPLSKALIQKVPEQAKQKPRALLVNQNLSLKGTPHNNVFALGDCSFLAPTKLVDHVDELYSATVKHAFGAGTDFLQANETLAYRFPQLAPSKNVVKTPRNNLTKGQFTELLGEIDAGYKPPMPTAQNAGQQGAWLALMMNDFDLEKEKKDLPSFVENFKGALAYIGRGESVALTPWFNIIGGFHSTLFWKTCYWSMQMSVRNRILLLNDWIRVRLSGRDMTCSRMADLTHEVQTPTKPPTAGH